MKVRFGLAPIAWTKSHPPELGGANTLETLLPGTS